MPTYYSKVSIAVNGILKQIEFNSADNVFVVRQIDIRNGSGTDPKSLTHALMTALVATAADGGFASVNALAAYVPNSQKGAVNGVATLDGSGTLTAAQIPSSLSGHIDGGASKHDATEVDYERANGSKKNIAAASDDVESALTNLDDAIGALDATPTNYFVVNPAIVADHLAGIDTALTSAGGRVKISAADTTSGYLDASLTAGSGLSKSITNPGADEILDLAVNVDGSTLEIDSDALRIKDLGVSTAKIAAAAVTDAKIATGIDAIKIADGSVTSTEFQYINSLTSNAQTQLTDNATAISDHLSDTSDAHDASAISNIPAGNLVATDVQAALNELDSEKVAKSGDTMSGNLAMGSNKITGLAEGTASGDAMRYEQAIHRNGVIAFTANQSMGGFKLTSVADGTVSSDAVNLGQLDAKVAKSGSSMDAAANITFSSGGEVLGLPASPSGAGAAASKAYVDTKAPLASPTFSGTITTPLTASRALTTGASSELAVSATTATELGYVSGVTSAIQTQFTGKQSTSEKGQANGYASLDGGGKVPASQLPNAIMEYQGTWDASTNSPTLADGTGSTGDVYRVTVAGSQFTPSIAFAVGDYAIYNGTKWEKSDTTDSVPSVFGRTGDVSAQSGDYTATQITNTPAGGIAATTVQAAINELDTEKFNSADFNSSFDTRLGTKTTTNLSEGSNLYFTDERAQDAIGTILADSATIDFTYNDGTPDITAIVKTNSISESHLTVSVAGPGMTGGNGTALTIGANADGSITVNADDIQVAYAPSMKMILTAGEGLSANITYFVRWALTGETAGRVYKADKDAASTHKFYAFGTVRSGSAVSAGDSVTVNIAGTITLGSGDTNFASGDVGKALYLTAAGAFSATAPTATDEAVFRVGIIQEVSKIYLGQYELNYING